MSSKMAQVNLSKETIIQLQTLALPGESLESVIQRAALALQTLESGSDRDTMMQRMDSMESRLSRIEHRCHLSRDTQDDREILQTLSFEPSESRM